MMLAQCLCVLVESVKHKREEYFFKMASLNSHSTEAKQVVNNHSNCLDDG